jgi:hypothetical protein
VDDPADYSASVQIFCRRQGAAVTGQESAPAGIDWSVPHPARRYNYWLNGKDNYAADRASADAIEAVYPHIRTAAQENRRFLQRSVRHLVEQHGIRQFLDVGTGLPTADNTHEVAQSIDATARVVYVDNDPLVMTHARALLTSTPEGRTAYLEADLRNPAAILSHPELAATLDLTQPVALMIVAILHFVRDDDAAYASVRTLIDALPAGSFLVATHATDDLMDEQVRTRLAGLRTDFVGRSRDQFTRFFDGLELIEPGVTIVSQWRPEPGAQQPPPQDVSVYGGVARKP